MLQLIRERAQGWIAWVIVILICIPFALWGIQEYLGVDPNVPVAKVNGEEIGLQRFVNAYQRTQAQLRGQSLDDPAVEQRLKTDTLERIVRDELIVQAAASQGLRISDEQLAFAIQSQGAFQQEGQFSQPGYEAFVRSQGYTPGGFEQQYRRTLLSDQIFSALSDTAFATPSEAQRLLSIQRQKRTFSTLAVAPDRFADIDVTEAEVDAHFAENRAIYRSPEQVKVRYVRLSRRDLAATIEAADDELKALFESRKAAYSEPEQRRVRHILIRLAPDADAAAREAARARVEALRARIVGGEEFATVAKEASEDPSTAANGGDLGAFGRGVMDPAFEKAAFEQPVAGLSEPVLSSFGYHLIRVDEVVGGGEPIFEAVREDVLADYREGEADKLYYEQADRLHNLSYEQPDNLEVAAETLGLTIVETDFMGRGGVPGDEVASDPGFVRAAFSEDVLGARNNSEPVEIGDGSVVVLRVADHRPSVDRPLEEVRDQVVVAIRAEKSSAAAEALGRSLLAKLRAGEVSAEAAAAEAGAEWQRHESVARAEGGADPQARKVAFQMPQSEPGKVLYDGTTSITGSFVLVALDAVTEDGSEDDTLRNRMEAGIQRNAGQVDFQNLLKSLRDNAEVAVYEERL